MSKVFKKGAAVDVAPLSLGTASPPSDGVVRPYLLRQVGSSGSDANSRAPAAAGEQVPATPPVSSVPDLEAVRKAAYGQGFGDGERAGADRAAKELHSVMQSFRNTAGELAAYKPALRAEAEQELVELALTIARRVIHREVQVDRSSVVGIVRACIDRINGAEIHRLRVNPADAGIVGEYFRQSDDSDIEIIPDQSVAPGGAILHTSHGQLDARLESQLQEIEYGLMDR